MRSFALLALTPALLSSAAPAPLFGFDLGDWLNNLFGHHNGGHISWPYQWPWPGRHPGSSHPGPCHQKPTHKGWQPARGGCWTDGVDHLRALDHFAGNFDTDLTVETCLDLCESLGFFLAGVEFGQECSCGDTIIGNNTPTTSDKCNFPCHGNSTEQCGGQDATNIYVRDGFPFTTGPAKLRQYGSKGFANPQCWVDARDARILSGSTTLQPTDLMTVEKCNDACAAEGHTFSGLEFGRECYCGDAAAIPPSGQAAPRPIEECNGPCLGDASTFCGAPDRILVYTKY